MLTKSIFSQPLTVLRNAEVWSEGPLELKNRASGAFHVRQKRDFTPPRGQRQAGGRSVTGRRHGGQTPAGLPLACRLGRAYSFSRQRACALGAARITSAPALFAAPPPALVRAEHCAAAQCSTRRIQLRHPRCACILPACSFSRPRARQTRFALRSAAALASRLLHTPG